MHRDNRKIAAILAADVVGYSRLMGADEAGALAALKSRRGTFDELVREFGGREFGSVGDSLMAEFDSAVNALACALEIQQRVESSHAELPPARRMHLRIGVNLGDVIEDKGSVFGDAVNVAARLQALAKPGGVMISGPVYDQVHLKVSARYVDAGLRQVKNVEEPVRTFEVLPHRPPGLAGRIAGAVARVASWRTRRIALVVVTLAGAVALGQYWRDIPLPGTGRSVGELLQPEEPAAPANAIAVLPFVNLSGDPASDYLGDGLAEELANRLAKLPTLRVAARTSTFAFRGRRLAVPEIAAHLGVAHIVEGSVRRQGNRIRVSAALVDATTGSSRWSQSYESETGDAFAIEKDIGTRVIGALEHALGVGQTPLLPAPPDATAGAYDYFLQGLSYLRQPKSLKTLAAAEQLFDRALAEQPDFARAQAGLCETRVELYQIERLPAHVAVAEKACSRARALDATAQEVHMAVGRLRLATGDADEAEAAYRRALEIVPSASDALIGLAAAMASADRPDEAETVHRRAIEMQPRYAATHIAYGNFLFLRGRHADAIAPYERATVLAPDDPNAFNNLGSARLLLGELDQAAAAFERSLKLEPRRAGYSNAGTVHYYRGRFGDAVDMFRKASELAPADHRLWGNLADALLYDGRGRQALETYRRALELAEGELAINPKHAVNQAQAAYYASRLGDADRARQAISIALAEGEDSNYVHYYVALAELGLGDKAKAAAHIRRARELGYPDSLLRVAPELGDIQSMI